MSTPAPASWASRTAGRLRQSLLAAAAPVVACAVALGGLTAWTSFGNAGTPPDLAVTGARVFLPTGGTPDTAAFFRITNQVTRRTS